MSTLVVGVDGSAPSAAAVAWAAAFASRTGDTVLAVYAYEPDQAELPPDLVDERRGEAADALEEWLAPLRATSVGYEARIIDDGPSGGLVAVAEDTTAVLLVVGRRTGGHFGSRRVGSTAEHLAHHSTVPLALVPAETAPNLDLAVVGVAGWASDERAVGWCTTHARALKRVIAVHASAPPLELFGNEDPAEFRRRTAEKLDGDWTAPMRAAALEVTTTLSGDRPVHAVLDTAKEAGAGLVVAGTSTTSGLTGVRLGGVAMQLVHHADVPLVLVPPTGEG